MARKLRRNEIDLSATRVYHVVSRCVRAIPLLHASDDSRKESCMRCLQLLVENTAVAVAGFSLMDNHIHLLLRVDVERAKSWRAEEVATRWLKLHPVRNGYFQPVEPTPYQIDELVKEKDWVDATREKLCSISQFMKELKQRVSQAVNRQDRVAGVFWEGRYKIKPVFDEAQLLTTLMYIDLNPFAANVCKAPEQGRYTSLQGRLGRDKPLPVKEVPLGYEARGKKDDSTVAVGGKATHSQEAPAAKNRQHCDSVADIRQPSSVWLIPMDQEYFHKSRLKTASVNRKKKGRLQPVLPGLTIRAYVKLVDYVAKLMRHGKKRLAKEVKPILERLSLTPDDVVVAIGALRKCWASEIPKPAKERR